MRIQSILKRISAFALSCFVMIGSIGLSLDVHFCQGAVKSIGVFKAAESCQMDMGAICLHEGEDVPVNSYSKSSCCKNSSVYESLDIESRIAKEGSSEVYTLVDLEHSSLSNVSIEESVDVLHLVNPPFKEKDYQSLLQIYLI